MSLSLLLSPRPPSPSVRWHDDPVAVFDGVLSDDECAGLIGAGEALGFELAPINGLGGPVLDPDTRDNTRAMTDDLELARVLWDRLAPMAPQCPAGRPEWTAIGLNERFRFYRYRRGEAFRWHRDGSFARHPRERSFVTVLLYLNGGFRGGATELDGGPPVVPSAGRALLFDHQILHQGAPVTEGVKYVIRTDVMYRRA